MNLDEAKSVLAANEALRNHLQRATENLALFQTIDEARDMQLANVRTRLGLLKENLYVWGALMTAAAETGDPAVREAYDFLLLHHAAEMRRYADAIAIIGD